jgi:hypothetical protein
MNFFLLKLQENIDRTLIKDRINVNKETKRIIKLYSEVPK